MSQESAPKTFGDWVRARRTARRLGLDQAARLAGMSATHWRGIERGDARPGRGSVVAIAQALGERVSEALARAGYRPRADDAGPGFGMRLGPAHRAVSAPPPESPAAELLDLLDGLHVTPAEMAEWRSRLQTHPVSLDELCGWILGRSSADAAASGATIDILDLGLTAWEYRHVLRTVLTGRTSRK